MRDRELAEKIAVGCQQAARSICFVHYWSFNALWLGFNSSKGGSKKLTMKQLME